MTKEKFIKEYPCFKLYQVMCKNGAIYMKTKPKKVTTHLREDELKQAQKEGKSHYKIGYHRTVRETFLKKRKKRYINENKYCKINNKRNRKN